MNDQLSFKVLNEIGIISQLATTLFNGAMQEGMTLAQFSVLNHFTRFGGRKSPLQLASAFQVTKGTMTSTLQKLEAKGWVLVEGDSFDARKKWVSITSEGSFARQKALLLLEPHIKLLEGSVHKDIFLTILPHLMEIRKYFDEQRD